MYNILREIDEVISPNFPEMNLKVQSMLHTNAVCRRKSNSAHKKSTNLSPDHCNAVNTKKCIVRRKASNNAIRFL